MKLIKILKIICINLIIFIALIVLSEVFLFNTAKYELKEKLNIIQKMNKQSGKSIQNKLEYNLTPLYFVYDYEKTQLRKPEGLKYKKPPILLFGCSYTYGEGLKDKETFSYKLSNLSKRPVYNRANSGWGTQHILYQLKRDDFYKEVKPPEYIIYTLIDDHLNRLFRYQYPPPSCYALLRYKLTKDGFTEIYPFLPSLWKLYTVNSIQNFIERSLLTANFNRKKNLEYFYLMMNECKKLAKQHYPNAKFVILIYREQSNMFIDDPNLYKKLIDDNFIIIDTDDLIQRNLLNADGCKTIDHSHPSEKAWDLIVPALIKKLNL